MDRAIAFAVLLLVAITWLLYKLTEWLEPRGDKPGGEPQHDTVNAESCGRGVSSFRQKPIHQRLRN